MSAERVRQATAPSRREGGRRRHGRETGRQGTAPTHRAAPDPGRGPGLTAPSDRPKSKRLQQRKGRAAARCHVHPAKPGLPLSSPARRRRGQPRSSSAIREPRERTHARILHFLPVRLFAGAPLYFGRKHRHHAQRLASHRCVYFDMCATQQHRFKPGFSPSSLQTCPEIGHFLEDSSKTAPFVKGQKRTLNLSFSLIPTDDRLSQDNSTSPNATAGLLGNSTHNEFTTIVLPVLYLIIFLASLLLNGLAVWIFFHIRNKTSFIFYLKNIVVADLLMTLTFPFKIIQDSQLGPWHFNSFLCRYTTVLFYANMYTTIVFLGLISIDRYLKVVKPFGDSRMYSITFTKILSACVWVVMAFLALPNLILTNGYPTKKNIDDCIKLKSPLGVKWHTAVIYINTCMFVVVLIVLIGCYIAISRYIYKSSKQFISSSSRKRKHNQSIRVVVAVFFTCFLPYHLCRIPFTFSHLDKILDDSAHKILYYCKEMTLFLSACNVCLDPIIYFFMCRSFSRRLFRKSNMRTRSESIRSLQSVRRSEVRIYHEYTDV